LLFFPVSREVIDKQLVVSFRDNPCVRFRIFMDLTLLMICDYGDDYFSPMSKSRKILVYSATAGQYYRKIVNLELYRQKSVPIRKEDYINGKRPHETLVYEMPIGVDYLYYFELSLKTLAQYLALQLAHIERYTFKKNISSLVPDVNSRISLHLGYRSSPTVWDGGSSVDINAAPFFADGGGTIKSVEPVYMAPYSHSVPNLLPYLTLEEKTMFDFLNNHHNMTLWESLIGKEYIFKNHGEYSLDDYYKYQESSEVFFNRIKKPGSIWNGIDFFFSSRF